MASLIRISVQNYMKCTPVTSLVPFCKWQNWIEFGFYKKQSRTVEWNNRSSFFFVTDKSTFKVIKDCCNVICFKSSYKGLSREKKNRFLCLTSQRLRTRYGNILKYSKIYNSQMKAACMVMDNYKKII